jgi:hypothetical protein
MIDVPRNLKTEIVVRELCGVLELGFQICEVLDRLLQCNLRFLGFRRQCIPLKETYSFPGKAREMEDEVIDEVSCIEFTLGG